MGMQTTAVDFFLLVPCKSSGQLGQGHHREHTIDHHHLQIMVCRGTWEGRITKIMFENSTNILRIMPNTTFVPTVCNQFVIATARSYGVKFIQIPKVTMNQTLQVLLRA